VNNFVTVLAWIKMQSILVFHTSVYEPGVDCSEAVYERSMPYKITKD